MSWSSGYATWIAIALLEKWKCRDYHDAPAGATEKLPKPGEVERSLIIPPCVETYCCPLHFVFPCYAQFTGSQIQNGYTRWTSSLIIRPENVSSFNSESGFETVHHTAVNDLLITRLVSIFPNMYERGEKLRLIKYQISNTACGEQQEPRASMLRWDGLSDVVAVSSQLHSGVDALSLFCVFAGQTWLSLVVSYHTSQYRKSTTVTAASTKPLCCWRQRLVSSMWAHVAPLLLAASCFPAAHLLAGGWWLFNVLS